MKFTNVCPIQRYAWPKYLIVPEKDAWNEAPDDGDCQTVEALNDPESGLTYRVLEENVLGWGQHTHILRVKGAYDDYDVLATITQEESS